MGAAPAPAAAPNYFAGLQQQAQRAAPPQSMPSFAPPPQQAAFAGLQPTPSSCACASAAQANFDALDPLKMMGGPAPAAAGGGMKLGGGPKKLGATKVADDWDKW